MNKTPIEYVDYTWNPVTGCLHGCWYCYARRIAARGFSGKKDFTPLFHPHRMWDPHEVKKPSRIFVCSMGDLLGDWTPEYFINPIIRTARDNLHHEFLFLTKNPKRYSEFKWASNCWLGASATNQEQWDEAIEALGQLEPYKKLRFISCEPLLERIDPGYCGDIEWLIIGALTGPGAKDHEPDPEDVKHLISGFKGNYNRAAVFLKDNLNWPKKIQELPR